DHASVSPPHKAPRAESVRRQMRDVEGITAANGGDTRRCRFPAAAHGRISTSRCWATSFFEGQYQKMNAMAGAIIPHSTPCIEKIDHTSQAHTATAATNVHTVGSG